MPQTPRVSIITRTKNRPVLLRRALASVLDQTLSSWEMLIVNDGGDPEPVNELVAEVAIAAGRRIRVVHHDESRGMEAASNRALEFATGDYIVVHDDDDSWDPTFLETCVAYMDAADECVGGVVTHSNKLTERLDDDGVVVEKIEPYTAGLTSVTLIAMARSNMFPPIAFLYRRSALDEVGSYRADLPVLGDWEFNLRFLATYEIDVIPTALANYHIRPATKSGIYSNTIIGGLSLHQKYDTRLRNQLLRDDMKQGRPGLGFLINLGRQLSDQMWEMRNGRMVESTFGALRASGVKKFAVYGAGAMGRRIVTDAKAAGLTVERIVDRNQELWNTPIEGVTVVGLDDALAEGCDTFVIASLTYTTEIRSAISTASSARGLEPRIFEIGAAA